MKAGDLVVLWRDNGTALITKVRDVGEASGLAVVWLEGVPGYYAARMVRPATFHESALALLPAVMGVQ